MLWTVSVALLVVVLGQLVLAVSVNIDAKRRQLETPGKYFAGVSIPVIGLLVIVF